MKKQPWQWPLIWWQTGNVIDSEASGENLELWWLWWLSSWASCVWYGGKLGPLEVYSVIIYELGLIEVLVSSSGRSFIKCRSNGYIWRFDFQIKSSFSYTRLDFGWVFVPIVALRLLWGQYRAHPMFTGVIWTIYFESLPSWSTMQKLDQITFNLKRIILSPNYSKPLRVKVTSRSSYQVCMSFYNRTKQDNIRNPWIAHAPYYSKSG